MTTRCRQRPRAAAWLATVGCGLAGVVLLVGCQSTGDDQRDDAAQISRLERALASHASTVRMAAAAMPDDDPPAAEKQEKENKKKAPSALSSAKGEQQQEAGQAPDKKPDQLDREALAELIRKKIEQRRKELEAAGEAPPDGRKVLEARPGPPAHTSPTRPRKAAGPAQRPSPRGRAAQQAKGGKGCGSSGQQGVDLTPPAPDEPQPEFACDAQKVVMDAVWQGEKATFSWVVRNKGAGPLNVRIKGG